MITEIIENSKSKLVAALAYAERGWAVLPILPNQKQPATKHGVHDATTDAEQIRAWWQRNPNFNVGVACGQRSGLIVFDVDPRNGGEDSWGQWVDENGGPPEGMVQCTAGGGFHYLAEYTPDLRSCKLAEGVDLLSDGRYFIAAPSVVGEREYFWDGDDQSLFAVPQTWVEALTKNAKPDLPSEPIGETIPNGSRNTTLTSLGGLLRHIGLGEPEILAALTEANNRRCSDPLPEAEVRAIARSVCRYEPGRDVVESAILGQQAATAFLAGDATQGPQIVPFSEMRRSHPTLREPVVDGFLRSGETMNVIASPKAGKSWLMLSLAFAVSEGREWMGARCQRGRVLMIDNELHAETLADRFATMRDALGEDETQIDALSLRGENCDLLKLSTILDAIEPGSYRLIVLDALYRFLPQGTSENDNAQMMQLYNLLDAIAQRTGAAIAVVHHSSKGNQASKSQTDIGAGAGSIARAADTHLTIRPHEEAGYFVLEASTRSFQQPEPVSVYFKFPRWEVSALEANLKPERRNHQSEKDQETRATLLKVLKADKWTPKTKVRDLTGFGFDRITRGMRHLIESNQVVTKRVKSKAHRGKTVDVYQLTADVESLVNLV